MPHRELADGVLILVGGTLMLTPGFVTDVVGMLCILPFTRPIGRRVPGRRDQPPAGRASAYPGGPRPRPTARTQQRPGPDDVVQGEVVD